jgi:hypothetical protein
MSVFYKTNVNFCRQILIGTSDIVKLRRRGRGSKGNMQKAVTAELRLNWKRVYEKKIGQ